MAGKDSDKFVIAVKDIEIGNRTLPGKVLGKYRKRADAERDRSNLASRAGLQVWRVGLFQNGKLLE